MVMCLEHILSTDMSDVAIIDIVLGFNFIVCYPENVMYRYAIFSFVSPCRNHSSKASFCSESTPNNYFSDIAVPDIRIVLVTG